jgi:hypothetical protein
MSIHIPQIFLQGHGTGHNGNYLVNKYTSASSVGNGTTPSKEMSFTFDKNTSNYFYNELSKILNVNANSETNGDETNGDEINGDENIIVSQSSPNADNTDNICLITKEKLEPNHITLICKHKFNYLPIYYEVVNQKNKHNNMYETTKLLTNEIKCPYCRVITHKLLPYIAYPSVKVIKNVNSYTTSSYNNNPGYFLYAPKCSHADGDGDGDAENQHLCQKYGVYYEKENLLLCPQHYKTYLLKQKTGNKKMTKGVAEVVNDAEEGCCAILKSGKNIGRKCGMNIAEGEKMKYCKKHYKIYSNN